LRSTIRRQSPSDFARLLDDEKQHGLAKKWSSVLLDYKPVSKADLSLFTRTSFSTSDYLGDILAAAQPTAVLDERVIVSSLAFVSICSIVLPQFTFISDQIRSLLLLLSLAMPFALLLCSIIAPDIILSIRKSMQGIDPTVERERIAYHEAGHFLCGYLCGVPIVDYDISGERDAGAAIELPKEIQDARTMRKYISEKSGHLMVVAMAGVVSETLRFGNSKGGSEDISVLFEVCEYPLLFTARIRHCERLFIYLDTTSRRYFAIERRRNRCFAMGCREITEPP